MLEAFEANETKVTLACLWLDYVEFQDEAVRPRYLIRKQMVEPIDFPRAMVIAVALIDDPEPLVTMWQRLINRAGNPPVTILAAFATRDAVDRLTDRLGRVGAGEVEILAAAIVTEADLGAGSLPDQIVAGSRRYAPRSPVPDLVRRRSLLKPEMSHVNADLKI